MHARVCAGYSRAVGSVLPFVALVCRTRRRDKIGNSNLFLFFLIGIGFSRARGICVDNSNLVKVGLASAEQEDTEHLGLCRQHSKRTSSTFYPKRTHSHSVAVTCPAAPFCANGKRGLFIWQKRPIYMAKGAY